MDKFIKTLLHILSPPTGWILLLTPICAAALIFALTSDLFATTVGLVASVIIYVASAYTLASVIVCFPRIRSELNTFFSENKTVLRIKAYFYKNKYTSLYLTSLPVRVRISLYMSLALNLFHAVMKMTSGILYSSFWFGAEAVFYIVLGIVRFYIIRNMRKSGDMRHEYQVYRFCGFLLFALNAALTSIIFQMIFEGRSDEYPGILIIGVTTFAFIFLANAIYNLIEYRKLNSPIISAAKIIAFVQALVAIYSVQVSLFVTYGEDDRLELVLNSVFGVLLCVSIFGLAVFMVVRGFGKLKKLEPTG